MQKYKTKMETITIPISEYKQMQKRIEELQMLLTLLQNEAFMQQFRLFMQLMMAQQNMPNKSSMQDFLLKGSIMTDEQHQEFIQKRNHFNQWNQSV
ncbi:MAG: hypothetical protein EAZ97_06865 [Bacteroidetes bacterium]|nr:MAG: hypothetical protein EAZ97_06865 [Bacteroidota bacterium]